MVSDYNSPRYSRFTISSQSVTYHLSTSGPIWTTAVSYSFQKVHPLKSCLCTCFLQKSSNRNCSKGMLTMSIIPISWGLPKTIGTTSFYWPIYWNNILIFTSARTSKRNYQTMKCIERLFTFLLTLQSSDACIQCQRWRCKSSNLYVKGRVASIFF